MWFDWRKGGLYIDIFDNSIKLFGLSCHIVKLFAFIKCRFLLLLFVLFYLINFPYVFIPTLNLVVYPIPVDCLNFRLPVISLLFPIGSKFVQYVWSHIIDKISPTFKLFSSIIFLCLFTLPLSILTICFLLCAFIV